MYTLPVNICELLGPLSSFQSFDYAVDNGNTNNTCLMIYFLFSQSPNIKQTKDFTHVHLVRTYLQINYKKNRCLLLRRLKASQITFKEISSKQQCTNVFNTASPTRCFNVNACSKLEMQWGSWQTWMIILQNLVFSWRDKSLLIIAMERITKISRSKQTNPETWEAHSSPRQANTWH